MTAADRRQFSMALRGARGSLPAECQESFSRLVKLIRSRPNKFQLLIMDCRDERLQDRLIGDLDDFLGVMGRRPSTLQLSSDRYASFTDVEHTLAGSAETSDVIHVRGGPAWFDRGRWDDFNIRREAVAHRFKVSLVFWLDPESIRLLANVAIDLWAWRSAVITFSIASRPVANVDPRPARETEASNLLESLDDQIETIFGELREANLPDDLRLELRWDLSESLGRAGRNAEAEDVFRELMRVSTDERVRVGAAGKVADILEARGELDQALRIRSEEELPAFERLGDVRSRAITMGRIANLLQSLGALDEAQRIRRDADDIVGLTIA